MAASVDFSQGSKSTEFGPSELAQAQASAPTGMHESDIHQLLLSSQTLISGKTHAEYQQILNALWENIQQGKDMPPCISFVVNQTTDTHFQIPPEMLLRCRFDAVTDYNKFNIYFDTHTPSYPLGKLCHLSKHRFLEYHTSAHDQIQLQMRGLLAELPASVRNSFCGDIYKHRSDHMRGMKDYWSNHDSFIFGEIYLTDFYRSSLASQTSVIHGDLSTMRERYFIASALERHIAEQVGALQRDTTRFDLFMSLAKEVKQYQEVTSGLEDIHGSLVKWADALTAFERAEKRVAEGQSASVYLSVAGSSLAELLAQEEERKKQAATTYCSIL